MALPELLSKRKIIHNDIPAKPWEIIGADMFTLHSKNLLAQPAYRSISRDPTNKIKARLITILRKVKNQTGLDSNTYKVMYPMGCSAPKFYGIPKIHKLDTPFRPIVSSHKSVTYGVAKVLTKILSHWLVSPPTKSTAPKTLLNRPIGTLMAGECLSSYAITALFTSVPVDLALGIIKDLLEKDSTLKERTVLLIKDISLLLEFRLKNTLLSFQGQFYEQVEGADMGSLVSPIVSSLYMEYFEQKALSTPTPQNMAQVCG